MSKELVGSVRTMSHPTENTKEERIRLEYYLALKNDVLIQATT